MKKKILATIWLVMICGIAFFGVNTHNAQAATVKYEMKKVKSVVKDNNGNLVVVSFKYPQFKGHGKGVKKLNKLIKKDLKSFKKEKKDFLSACREDINAGRELMGTSCTYTYKVTYNKNNIISVKGIHEVWYEGWERCYEYAGYNFNAKTGKTIKLSNIVGVSKSKLKQAVWNKLITEWSDESGFNKELFEKIRPSKYDFYIKGNKVYVVFDKYEIGYGITGAPAVSLPLNL